MSEYEEMTCSKCKGKMRFNVPRLGPDGGFVHSATGKIQCPVEMTPPPGFTEQTGTIWRELTTGNMILRENGAERMLVVCEANELMNPTTGQTVQEKNQKIAANLDIVKDFSKQQALANERGRSNVSLANSLIALHGELHEAREALVRKQHCIEGWVKAGAEWVEHLDAWRKCAERFSNLIDRMNFGDCFKPITEAQAEYHKLKNTEL